MTGTALATTLDRLAGAWEGAWLGRAEFERCCTPDVHYEDPVAIEPMRGVVELAAYAEALRRAFPDLRIERRAPAVGDARNACIPWRVLGTHRAELGPLPETERFVALHGVHYVELQQGAIRRARGFFDLYDAGTQLGLLPKRGGLGETALLLLRGFGLRPRA